MGLPGVPRLPHGYSSAARGIPRLAGMRFNLKYSFPINGGMRGNCLLILIYVDRSFGRRVPLAKPSSKMRSSKLWSKLTSFIDFWTSTETIFKLQLLLLVYTKLLNFITACKNCSKNADIEDALYNGKIGGLIGIDGGHTIDNRLSVLRNYYQLGARYLTLSHFCETPW